MAFCKPVFWGDPLFAHWIPVVVVISVVSVISANPALNPYFWLSELSLSFS